MKLTEGQAESMELLYSSLCNAIVYAEDLALTGNGPMKHAMHQILVKARWSKEFIESKLPEHKRRMAKDDDHMFYDELMRCATHMNDEMKTKLETFIRNL